ncbi:MAG TPA: bifunctional [glutamate--ammonia ligase]-adenylyl-L-tyrosine phosphorylase/[glutamate--ammonia-ligase] adenylyltransferase, partial [Byssovorax sp.]
MHDGGVLDLAARVDPARAPELATRFAASLGHGSAAHAIATLLGAAYPALVPTLVRDPGLAARMAADGFASARDRATLRRVITARFGDLGDEARVRRELRLAARDERARVALREILPPALGGADVDVTSAELAALADVTLQIAVDEARFHVEARCGAPRTSSGAPGRFAVLGMGKLGGDELNAGSDVDLIYVYDTDDGVAEAPAGSTTLHDFWTRVAKRVTATLEEPTEDGFVWRVDLRLRPEGRGGPIVNSLAAAERYYEAFGRLWERAALLRARPVAGDLDFGAEVLESLAPFVWRRAVDPRIAVDMIELARRSRAELSDDGARDLKLRPGGIREAEFFAQTLQLVWGGKAKQLRVRGTLEALRRLRAQGLVSDREFRELSDAYLALRRAEHVVQTATGIQTHALPGADADLDRTARALGFADGGALTKDFAHKTRLVAERFRSLAPPDAARAVAPHRWTEAFAALERSNEDAFVDAVVRVAARAPASPFAEAEAEARWQSAARDLAALARHPDAPLGARTREAMPELAETVLDGVVDASDPEQAARYLRRIFGRVRHPGIYAKLLVDDRRGLRRLVEAVGASAFVGEAVANQPDLGDAVLFRRGAPSPAMARAEVVAAEQSVAPAAPNEDDEEVTIGALRGAKARVTIEVALADLAGELDTRGATLALSELADATLDAAARAVLGGDERGLAVLAMGKLGGREIGYGSDLDVLFLFAPERAPPGVEPEAFFGRAARRMMRLIGVSHAAGPGYELDTRLRPSGSQGLLVTSVDAFARYHGAAVDV